MGLRAFDLNPRVRSEFATRTSAGGLVTLLSAVRCAARAPVGGGEREWRQPAAMRGPSSLGRLRSLARACAPKAPAGVLPPAPVLRRVAPTGAERPPGIQSRSAAGVRKYAPAVSRTASVKRRAEQPAPPQPQTGC